MTKPHFSILLVTQNLDQLDDLARLIKRHFSSFYIANTAEKAAAMVVEKNIRVLLFALDDVTESELCYLHMIRANRHVESIMTVTMLLCDKHDVGRAFELCRKDIFTDYFIASPLYDPKHMLIRLRNIRRVLSQPTFNASRSLSIDELGQYFSRISDTSQALSTANKESLSLLVHAMTSSLDTLKARLNEGQKSAESVTTIIDQHHQTLIPQLEEQAQDAGEQIQHMAHALSAESKLNKIKLEEGYKANLSCIPITVIDDSQSDQLEVANILEAEGFSVCVAKNAAAGLKTVIDTKPNLVLIDLTLPDMSALFVINQIKERAPLRHAKIIALANEQDTEQIMDVVKVGVADVLIKPLTKDHLLAKVKANL